MDPYKEIAFLYDWEHEEFTADLAFYLSMVREGPVLEVGSGTGRVMAPLLSAGLEVWGLEPSTSMLERACDKIGHHGRAHLLLGELGSMTIERRFAYVLMPLNVLWHYPDDASIVAALTSARNLMMPGGVLIVDTSNPLDMADKGANGELRVRRRQELDVNMVTCFSAAWDDEAEQRLRLLLTYDIVAPGGSLRRAQTELQLRYLYRPQLELLLLHAGLQIESVYGSYDLDPYASDAPNLLAVATLSH